jgi:seryl-tRNA synthetase
MSSNDLSDSLKNLQAKLKEAGEIDEESKKLLKNMMEDIHRLIDKETETHPKESENIIDRLKEAAEEFERSHPELASSINTVINGLSNFGL